MDPRTQLFDAAWRKHALLTCEEMRAAEGLSVARGGPPLFDLMKAAGEVVARALMDGYPKGRVLVLCGTGNNGGDGYVAAAHLKASGWDVHVAALGPPTMPEAKAAAEAWGDDVEVLTPNLIGTWDYVIDALFGIGLSRPLEGNLALIIEAVNGLGLPLISADIPSGVCGDTGRIMGAAIQAAVTVTFFRKKRGHCLMPGLAQCGEVRVADIGLRADVLDEACPLTTENHRELWQSLLPVLKAGGHKYDRGHALIFGGPMMTGASRLAARAAQKIGAGLVTLAAPPEAWEVYAKALESVIVVPYRNTNLVIPAKAGIQGHKILRWVFAALDSRFRGNDKIIENQALLADPKRGALLIGPGLGLDPANKALVLAVLATRKPSVLDADALTLFADAPEELFAALHEACVLTPHEGEFARLFGLDPGADKITRAVAAARRADCTVLLKGADTVIAAPSGHAVINTNAPPWLATGGAGDVLAGMILGLITAGMPPFAAACAAAFRHGDIATAHGPGLIAEDLVAAIS